MTADLDRIWRDEWGRLLALLVGQFRRLDLAEDALADAFEAATRTWPRDGIPANPAAWLLTAARRRAIDRIRAEAVAARKEPLLVVDARIQEEAQRAMADAGDSPAALADERLRLVFLCAHPALASEAAAALTLRPCSGCRPPTWPGSSSSPSRPWPPGSPAPARSSRWPGFPSPCRHPSGSPNGSTSSRRWPTSRSPLATRRAPGPMSSVPNSQARPSGSPACSVNCSRGMPPSPNRRHAARRAPGSHAPAALPTRRPRRRRRLGGPVARAGSGALAPQRDR